MFGFLDNIGHTVSLVTSLYVIWLTTNTLIYLQCKDTVGTPDANVVCNKMAEDSHSTAHTGWALATTYSTILLVLAIVALVSWLPTPLIILKVPCKAIDAVTGMCPTLPFPTPFSMGSGLQLIQGICLTAFSASVISAINTGASMTTANLVNLGLLLYYAREAFISGKFFWVKFGPGGEPKIAPE